MDVEELIAGLGPRGAVERRRDGWWAVWPGLDVRAMAKLMLDHEIRLATVTGVPGEDGGLRLIYHWDVGAAILNLETSVHSGHVATIADILPAADWVERELRDYFGLTFDGRVETPPLMLRDSDAPGFFNRAAEVGRDVDPAEEAHEDRAEEKTR